MVTLTDVDEFDTSRIADTNPAANSVFENATVGTVVGITASTIDADTTLNRVVYALDDNAGGRFSIDGNTGVVTVADGSALNDEANVRHSMIVRASSDDGKWSVMTIEIAVLNVAERPIGLSDHYSTSYLDVLRVHGVGVLDNDFDPDGDMLTLRVQGQVRAVQAIRKSGYFETVSLR